MLKVITHNVMLIVRGLLEVFYRAVRFLYRVEPFVLRSGSIATVQPPWMLGLPARCVNYNLSPHIT
jgi:hypothetical protein